jgi:hypothetical protein
MPFVEFPTSDNVTLTQGYGLNTFVYRNSNYYDQTNHLHSGLDYFGTRIGDANNRLITLQSVCDGLTVNVSPEPPNRVPEERVGAVISIRCFAPDGSLSSIAVRYNHLDDETVINLVPNQSILLAGQSMNTFVSDDTIFEPHLHLEAVFVPLGETIATIRMNPSLLFDQTSVNRFQSTMELYYPAASIERSGNTRLFEYVPFDTNDPQNRDFSIGHSSASLQSGEVEDYDLGINEEEYNFWLPLGDNLTTASNLINIWLRSGDGGIQNISISAPEWVETVYLNTTSLIEAMESR